ncbi:Transcription factor zip1 [Psilocybe cubensis]|uniref:BZIP domain-containing protein n=2 Tax=Psilocybe cubensis TaxID=181762 RepID=A0A8H7Y840_PSICU|nr:Transcription factor zip1 [Psilocybe cubensis]KAH9487069.1 Transcription factor zip1 [Psilocybe cubensis]
MLSLKSEALEDTVCLTSPEPSGAQELQFWETFAFDMEREQHANSRNPRDPQRSRSTSTSNTTAQHSRIHSGAPSVQDAALLAQFAAATGGGDLSQVYSNIMAQNPYPSMGPTPGFYGNFLHHGSMPTQLPPLSSLDFPWNNVPQQPQASSSHYDHRQEDPNTRMHTLPPYMDAQFTPSGPRPAQTTKESKRGKAASSSTVNENRSTSSPEVDMTEAERAAIADEKRRRNTAASARFRIKKKHKTLGLERSVSDLTGRAEELEREAADLRRENGWLKEIVMLKGTRFAANNAAHREALSQAAALATGGYTDASREPAGSSTRKGEASESERSESESSDVEEKKSKTKGKGKKSSKNE